MKRSKRLEVVLDMASEAEQIAAKALESARAQRDADQKKMSDLQHYYEDYEQSFRRPALGVRAEEVMRQRAFLLQLSDACEQQSRVVEQRDSVVRQKQGVWQQAHLKRKALEDLIHRFRQDEARILSKQEEKMLDEWFTQTMSHRESTSLT